ncbi:MAG: hypothetical protein ABIY63_05490, partial [Fibrobacteria bacterium]
MKSLNKILVLSMALASGSLIGCMAGDPASESSDSVALRTGQTPGALDSAKSESSKTMEKVTICHLPPGNPANMQTLSVGSP